MKAKVIKIEEDTGFIIVDYDYGQRCTIELLGDYVEIGDILSGDFTALGGQIMHNITQNRSLDVFVQDHT